MLMNDKVWGWSLRRERICRMFPAMQLRREIERGLNRPFLVTGASQDKGERHLLIDKSRVQIRQSAGNDVQGAFTA
jgi:hypothetical protein